MKLVKLSNPENKKRWTSEAIRVSLVQTAKLMLPNELCTIHPGEGGFEGPYTVAMSEVLAEALLEDGFTDLYDTETDGADVAPVSFQVTELDAQGRPINDEVRQRVVREEGHAQAHPNGRAADVAQHTSSDRSKNISGQFGRRHGHFFKGLHGVDLVLDLVVEVRRYRRGVHDADVNALALELDRDRRRELGHERFCSTIDDREGVRDVGACRRREDDASFFLVFY